MGLGADKVPRHPHHEVIDSANMGQRPARTRCCAPRSNTHSANSCNNTRPAAGVVHTVQRAGVVRARRRRTPAADARQDARHGVWVEHRASPRVLASVAVPKSHARYWQGELRVASSHKSLADDAALARSPATRASGKKSARPRWPCGPARAISTHWPRT